MGSTATSITEQSLPVLDALGRPMRSLRVSVTDRCNLRCQYCMPEKEYVWLRRDEILDFEEIAELVGVFSELGVDKVRLTGGEPLLRRNLPALVKLLASNPSLRDMALTTNGLLLREHARALREAGVHRLTVSLDTLRPDRFRALTGGDALAQTLIGIAAARDAGFQGLKINTVIIHGFNEDELADLIEFGREIGAEVRFIEYMDVGGATRWSMDQVFSKAEMLARLEAHYGPIQPLGENGSAPAERFALPDGTTFGVIASTTQPFCRTCDRGRLTPDGMFFLCLYAKQGIDLKHLLRGGAAREEITRIIVDHWQKRTDRGAEERLNVPGRGVLYRIEELKKDPHLEMHTRGG